ncbi:hypothetical protein [Shinella zoogloeoides]|nr:hypothetical protein [Shinella zoogloeoides]
MAINSLQTILESYRDNARTQRDKGSLETIRIVRALPRLDIA